MKMKRKKIFLYTSSFLSLLFFFLDSWMSYGIDKAAQEERVKRFGPYRINAKVMAAAKKVSFPPPLKKMRMP